MASIDRPRPPETIVTEPTRPRGRPPVRIMPEPIPDTPENVVRTICQGPPKRDWEFLKPAGAGYRQPPPRRSPSR